MKAADTKAPLHEELLWRCFVLAPLRLPVGLLASGQVCGAQSAMKFLQISYRLHNGQIDLLRLLVSACCRCLFLVLVASAYWRRLLQAETRWKNN